jgi:PAS domain S-box-containing protein
MKNNTPRNPGELRRQAEERLSENQSGQMSEVGGQRTPEDTTRMLHELRVHQIELEMQNEELRAVQAEIEAGRVRYFDLYDMAPVGYCTVSEHGLILEANLTAATLLGTARGNLVKRPLSHFIVKEDQDIYYLHRKQLFALRKPQEFELRLVKPDGTFFWAHLTATAAQAEDGTPVCRVVLSNITERKQREAVSTFLARTGGSSMDRPFFQTLAKYLAESLEMDFVCIDRLEGDGLDARTVAVYCDGHFEDNVTYALKDTPCGDVVGKTVCCFPASVCQFFPRDQVLQDLRAESYVGVTLFGLSGQPIGLIAVISRRPLANRSQAEAILQTVGLRAAAELERLDAEEQKAAAFEALQHEKDELKRWQSLTVGRELVMIGMKKEVNALLKQAGQPDKYEIVAGKTE